MAQSLWDAAADLIKVTESHPFLVAMIDGSLHLDNFRYYVIQDALYLTDFKACLELLASKMKLEMKEDGDITYKEECIQRVKELAVGIDEAEKELHRSYFTQWDITDQDATPMPNTVLYTSYILRVVSTRPYEEGLAVLLPCFWVYMHVGKCMLQLRDKLGSTVQRSPQLDEWIDMYAGEEFEKEVTSYIDIVDKVAREVEDEETLCKMKEHFVMCCKLEYMFWTQAETLMKWPDFIKEE
jgi:thiaminase/transcriptional activator TenA